MSFAALRKDRARPKDFRLSLWSFSHFAHIVIPLYDRMPISNQYSLHSAQCSSVMPSNPSSNRCKLIFTCSIGSLSWCSSKSCSSWSWRSWNLVRNWPWLPAFMSFLNCATVLPPKKCCVLQTDCLGFSSSPALWIASAWSCNQQRLRFNHDRACSCFAFARRCLAAASWYTWFSGFPSRCRSRSRWALASCSRNSGLVALRFRS